MTCAAIDESVLSLAVLNVDGWGLELTFWIEADRCAHRLAAIDGTRRVVMLESIEGAADDLWPPSPPWQQVNAPFAARLFFEKRASEKLSSGNHAVPSAMLVGAAGASHWSASVEGVGVEGIGLNVTQTEENQNQSSTGWLFDVACRAKRPPERLISTYRIVDPSQIVTAASASDSPALGPRSLGEGRLGGGLLELQTDIGRYQLRGLPLGSTYSDSCQLCVSDQRVELSAPMSQVLPSPDPTTYRWRYRISTT
ncbi:MAG: hypothetical protein ABGX16_20630 [Pirellulales bacterium]